MVRLLQYRYSFSLLATFVQRSDKIYGGLDLLIRFLAFVILSRRVNSYLVVYFIEEEL